MTLYECKPMMAKISKAQCMRNRSQRDDHGSNKMADARCKSCAGVGEPTKIDTQEIIETATKNKPCKMASEGCKAFSWKAGYCWKHHPDHVANKKAACADKQIIRDIHKAAEPVVTFTDDQVRITEPKVSGHEIHCVNLIEVFKQKQAAELDVFICELSKLSDPVDKLMFAGLNPILKISTFSDCNIS
jgi:excinuclease UvrABC ATPase subunit